MLILTRSQNESIIINDDIKITVISDRHDQVKLGIEAPDSGTEEPLKSHPWWTTAP